MSEHRSNTPVKVIFEETIQEIRRAFQFGDLNMDAAKVAELLIVLPNRLAQANDVSIIPEDEMENLRRWSESAQRSKMSGDVERVPYDILYPWGSKANDKNGLEKLFERIYSSSS